MYCSRCGREIQAGASFCWNCGAAVAAPGAGPVGAPAPEPGETVLPAAAPGHPMGEGWRTPEAAPPPGAPAAGAAPGQWARPFEAAAVPGIAPAEPRAGGFWRRVWAWMIDAFLLNILNLPFALLWVSPHLESLSAPDLSPEQAAAIFSGYLLAGTTGFLISWIYFAGLECSVAQATLGKMALGVKVCDRELRRLTFWHATGRHFAKIASNLTFGIGYLMAAFTARKRALHDMIAGTRVIRG